MRKLFILAVGVIALTACEMDEPNAPSSYSKPDAVENTANCGNDSVWLQHWYDSYEWNETDVRVYKTYAYYCHGVTGVWAFAIDAYGYTYQHLYKVGVDIESTDDVPNVGDSVNVDGWRTNGKKYVKPIYE